MSFCFVGLPKILWCLLSAHSSFSFSVSGLVLRPLSLRLDFRPLSLRLGLRPLSTHIISLSNVADPAQIINWTSSAFMVEIILRIITNFAGGDASF